jgi:hypothetical protein
MKPVDQKRLERVARSHEPGEAISRQPRREVDLSGYAALDNGTTFRISVLDLSYDGCKVQTELALLPGLRLKLSILGLGGALEAVVRWSRGRKAGLKFSSRDIPQAANKRREHERFAVTANASLRRVGRDAYQARIFDFTTSGCKVEFIERPKIGELLWVKFSGLDSIEAKVRWVDNFYGGLEFVRPIYPAVFELLLARLRA